MRYPDGQQVQLGDVIRFGASDSIGRVVGVIDANEYESGFDDGWSHLSTGVLIDSSKYGLMHFPLELDPDIVLVSRAT